MSRLAGWKSKLASAFRPAQQRQTSGSLSVKYTPLGHDSETLFLEDAGAPDDEDTEVVEDKFKEAALFLNEGINNHKIKYHPSDAQALQAYRILHSRAMYVSDLVFALVLLLLVLIEPPAVLATPSWIPPLIEILCLVFFSGELVLKYRWLKRGEFFRHRRTVMKLITIIIMCGDAVAVLIVQSPYARFGRAVRPFFLIDNHYSSRVRRVFRQIALSIPPIMDMLIILLVVMFLFVLAGFYLFSGNPSDPGFATLGDTFISLFVLITTANFPDVMLPSYKKNSSSPIFFIVFLVCCLYILLNLLHAVVYESFAAQEKNKFRKLLLHKRASQRKCFELLTKGKVALEFTDFKGLMKHFAPSRTDEQVLVLYKSLKRSSYTLPGISLMEFYGLFDALSLDFEKQTPLLFGPESSSAPAGRKPTLTMPLVDMDTQEEVPSKSPARPGAQKSGGESRDDVEPLVSIAGSGSGSTAPTAKPSPRAVRRESPLSHSQQQQQPASLTSFVPISGTDVEFMKSSTLPSWLATAVYTVQRLTLSSWFDRIIAVIVFINVTVVLIESSVYASIVRNFDEHSPLKWLNLSFALCYCIETVMRFITLGVGGYFVSYFNRIDLIVITISIFGHMVGIDALSIVCLPMRLVRFITLKRRIGHIVATLFSLIPKLFFFLVTLLCVFYAFAIVGIELFEGLVTPGCCGPLYDGSDSGLYYLNNFDNVLRAYVTLFELMAMNNNNVLMEAIATVAGRWTRLYFLLFNLVSVVVVLNVVMAFIFDSFLVRMKLLEAGSFEEDTPLSSERHSRGRSASVSSEKSLGSVRLSKIHNPHTFYAGGHLLSSVTLKQAVVDVAIYPDEMRLWQPMEGQQYVQYLKQRMQLQTYSQSLSSGSGSGSTAAQVDDRVEEEPGTMHYVGRRVMAKTDTFMVICAEQIPLWVAADDEKEEEEKRRAAAAAAVDAEDHETMSAAKNAPSWSVRVFGGARGAGSAGASGGSDAKGKSIVQFPSLRESDDSGDDA